MHEFRKKSIKRTDYLQTASAQPVFKEKLCDPKCVIHKITKAGALVHNCFPYGISFASTCLLGTLHKQISCFSGGSRFNFLKVENPHSEVQHCRSLQKICSLSRVGYTFQENHSNSKKNSFPHRALMTRENESLAGRGSISCLRSSLLTRRG